MSADPFGAYGTMILMGPVGPVCDQPLRAILTATGVMAVASNERLSIPTPLQVSLRVDDGNPGVSAIPAGGGLARTYHFGILGPLSGSVCEGGSLAGKLFSPGSSSAPPPGERFGGDLLFFSGGFK